MPKKEEKADFFIDGDTEGSGSVNLEGLNDLESSGSGNGPDDEDAELDTGDTLPNGTFIRISLLTSYFFIYCCMIHFLLVLTQLEGIFSRIKLLNYKVLVFHHVTT